MVYFNIIFFKNLVIEEINKTINLNRPTNLAPSICWHLQYKNSSVILSKIRIIRK